MPIDRTSLPVRSLSVFGGALALGLMLSGTIAPAQAHKRPALQLRGRGCLPLSGDLSAAGDAFRQGFLSGLTENADSQYVWNWQWTDNGSDPMLAQAWIDTLGRKPTPDILLAGLGPAMEGFRYRDDSVPCMVMGDGSKVPGNVFPLWPSTPDMRTWLLEILRNAPKPVAVVLVASGSWAEIILQGVRDSLPGLLVLPHDMDNTRWDEEIKRLLETRPRTILFWNRPHEASSLLSRRLGWGLFRKAYLLVPEGTVLPDSVEATVLAPVWQPSIPPDSLQSERYRRWGRQTGAALAMASRIMIRDSLPRLSMALTRVARDTTGDLKTTPEGWIPRLSPSKIPPTWPHFTAEH